MDFGGVYMGCSAFDYLAHNPSYNLTEICDGLDNNCNGQIDEELPNCGVCGDGICNGIDNCSNCPADCGVCPGSVNVNGRISGGGGIPNKNITNSSQNQSSLTGYSGGFNSVKSNVSENETASGESESPIQQPLQDLVSKLSNFLRNKKVLVIIIPSFLAVIFLAYVIRREISLKRIEPHHLMVRN
jgi:hypothetical protein